MNLGKIKSIIDHHGSTPNPFNGANVISASEKKKYLLSKHRLLQNIGIIQPISHYKTDCKTTD
jgi:hypothetical protein